MQGKDIRRKTLADINCNITLTSLPEVIPPDPNTALVRVLRKEGLATISRHRPDGCFMISTGGDRPVKRHFFYL